MSVRSDLDAAIEASTLQPADAATVALARVLADQLDDVEGAEDVVRLAPRFLAVLESLGMTPRARAAIARRIGAPDGRRSPLDQLRERRRARADRAAGVDSATEGPHT